MTTVNLSAWVALMIALLPFQANAGLSGENVIVVVNGGSVDSRTLANHYVHLRDIPSCNVVVLTDVPDGNRCELDDFKNKILLPILKQLDARKISAQTRVIAYSCDFPTAIGISEHHKRLPTPAGKKIQQPTGSLTGMTYFFNYVQADEEGYLGLQSNFYARGELERHFVNPYQKPEQRDLFEEATKNRADEDFAVAAIEFEKLFDLGKTQSPVAILAAECFALAGDDAEAIRMIRSAITSGWSSRRYLRDSKSFSNLIDSTAMAKAIEGLPDQPTVAQDPIGFSAASYWAINGWPSTNGDDGVRYLASCMLGIVAPRGNTMDEAIQILARAATCDRSYPDAAFWFTKTGDVRSTTRFPGVADALLWIGTLKKDAAIIGSPMPKQGGSCAGLMLGTPSFQIDSRQWNFVPGAISDNLTSYGAAFNVHSQTKMTELLRAGAAMTSGPVAEPFAIADKFPTAMTYAYYASGVTAIEAFYLTLRSPYQSLIVGDPLAAPYAHVPNDQVRFANDPKQNRFAIGWTPSMASTSNAQGSHMELFVDGRMMKRWKPTSRTIIDLSGAPHGKLPMRVAVVGKSALQSRAIHQTWIDVGTGFEEPIVVRTGDRYTPNLVTVNCEDATEIVLKHHQETIGKISGDSGSLYLKVSDWGRGPLRVRPIATVIGKEVMGQDTIIEIK